MLKRFISIEVLPFVFGFAVVACVGGHDTNSNPDLVSHPEGEDIYVDSVHHFVPVNGFVPDSATAIRIAEAVLIPIYGASVIDDQRPLAATLHAGIWTVTGTLMPNQVGGVAIVEISRESGCIQRVSHSL